MIDLNKIDEPASFAPSEEPRDARALQAMLYRKIGLAAVAAELSLMLEDASNMSEDSGSVNHYDAMPVIRPNLAIVRSDTSLRQSTNTMSPVRAA